MAITTHAIAYCTRVRKRPAGCAPHARAGLPAAPSGLDRPGVPAGVALPYSLLWSMVWFVLCWGSVGVLAAGFGRRSRVTTIALWAAVLVTLVGIVVAVIALPRSQMDASWG
ncbi:hypothetical protein GCM10011581_35390 [Saccharopolyspora subtropica]|uniref:Uncharacterized protein n=1 Tax=Saccharopolyspora thermophila TaxID=89367 RepID=A0A917K360_9PSEU|nr:hypothetical protein GCM10011581_35390 [Saccharopolyspora subtropica]